MKRRRWGERNTFGTYVREFHSSSRSKQGTRAGDSRSDPDDARGGRIGRRVCIPSSATQSPSLDMAESRRAVPRGRHRTLTRPRERRVLEPPVLRRCFPSPAREGRSFATSLATRHPHARGRERGPGG